MNKATRNAIERATQQARKLLDEDFSSQLEATFDVLRSGVSAPKGGTHLSDRQLFQRDKILAAIEHKRNAGMNAGEAVTDYVRDAAFTTINRFVALKMLEGRELVQECVTKGEQSAGYREFCGMAPGLALLTDGAGYRLYVESLFDEFSTEIKVLFDRQDIASVLWPRRQTLERLLGILNADDLVGVWGEDETIGWVYQYFNSGEERKEMRDQSQAPRNSRELAVRNQFFTPRYVVQFLTDNTLGRLWLEMHGEQTRLTALCQYLVRAADESTQPRSKKDPRDLRILDPACGSGHFLLYSFDLLVEIYEEAWTSDGAGPLSETTGRSLREDYPDITDLRRAVPRLIVEHNLYGVDIDPRCAQIAALALWLRAQRAWKGLGILASDRPQIQRTHIVVAEPVPGDAALVDEFAARLEPPLLRDLFKKMVGETRLAGELGTLLRLEDSIAKELHHARNLFVEQRHASGFLPGLEPVPKQGSLDFSGIDDDRFFHEAETRIGEALRAFAETATGSASAPRRLFAGDAAQGVALIDVVRSRFDVVLMNPPFGPSATRLSSYRGLPKDLYCWFVERATELLKPQGRVGAITSSSFRTYLDYEEYRNRFFVAGRVPLLADLGWGILDGAYVETAAYVVCRQNETVELATFIDVRGQSDRQRALQSSIQIPDHANYYVWDPRQFARIPGRPLLYYISEGARDSLISADRLDSVCDAISKGAGPHAIFYRLRWEVPAQDIGLKRKWAPFINGGSFSPFRRDDLLLLNWHNDGALVKSYILQRYPYLHGNTDWNVQMEDRYGLPGLTYGKKTTKFSAQVMPVGGIFSFEGIGLFPSNDSDKWWLLAYLNSQFVRAYLNATCGLHKNPPYVRNLPLPKFTFAEKELLAELAKEGWRLQLADAQQDERSAVFVLPWPLSVTDHRPITEVLCEVDLIVDATVGMSGAQLQRLLAEGDDVDENEKSLDNRRDSSSCEDELVRSWAFGVAIGRFDIRVATGERLIAPTADPFDPLPAESPGMLPSGDQAFMPSSGILVDDAGHPEDLVARLGAVYDRLGTTGPAPQTLRRSLAREFFAAHIKRYSKNRRMAPIYWQLATPSASYSVWLYFHALTSDTLFRVQNDYVARKLAYEERRLEQMMSDFRGETAAERKALASQQSFVMELHAFLKEVKLVAPLWKPDLDDGVIINFAPLWRLVHDKPWQRQLKATWSALCNGECDWAHLAMHLWPERVIPKCEADRSLAIAHALETNFFSNGEKSTGTPGRYPAQTAELVRSKTSLTVKAALSALLGAGAPSADSGGGD